MKGNIFELLNIPKVSAERHYWIIRTNGGTYYEDFVLHQYISIAWDYATLNILNNRVYYGKNVPLFRRNGYRKSGTMIP